MLYRIVYDYCDKEGYVDEKNLVEEFEGTHEEMIAYKRQMIENGCYHISVSVIDEDGEQW